MQSILAVVIVLGVLIAFHELGHFLAAKLLGVGVKVFCLGFGPRVVGKKIGQTEYRLAAIPLGGFVSMVGEHDEADLPEGFTAEQSFTRKPVWRRMTIVAAGPVFNLVLAWLLYWALFWSHGLVESQPVIQSVQPDSPALAAGVEAGDRVLSIDGQPIEFQRQIKELIVAGGGKAMDFQMQRGDATVELRIIPTFIEEKTIFGEDRRTPAIGVLLGEDPIFIPLQPGQAAGEALRETGEIIALTVQGFVKLIERVVPLQQVGGPIMIAQMVAKQAEQGLSNLVALTAIISVNLAVINLLPIPVLDGGHLLFLGLEVVRRKPVSERAQELTTRIGLVFLISLMLLAVYNDLHRIFSS